MFYEFFTSNILWALVFVLSATLALTILLAIFTKYLSHRRNVPAIFRMKESRERTYVIATLASVLILCIITYYNSVLYWADILTDDYGNPNLADYLSYLLDATPVLIALVGLWLGYKKSTNLILVFCVSFYGIALSTGFSYDKYEDEMMWKKASMRSEHICCHHPRTPKKISEAHQEIPKCNGAITRRDYKCTQTEQP